MYWLVLSTFIAGSSWGPLVQLTPTPDDKTCQRLSAQVIADVKSQAHSNLVGPLEQIDVNGAVVLVRGDREVTRVRCAKGH